MRKYQNRCFTRSICPTLSTRPASSVSSMGRTLNTWQKAKLSPVRSVRQNGNSRNKGMKLV